MTASRGKISGVGQSTTSGFLWLVVQSFAARGIGFVSQLILARLLMPEDFGAIGLAYTVTGIANSLISFGIDDVLLQRQKSIGQWTTPAFWLSLGIGVAGMIGMIAFAPYAARWYHSPDLVGLIIAIAIATPLRTLATVPSVCIRAEMDFRFLATYNTFDIFALQLLTILFAACGMRAYAFALPFPIVAATRAVWFWRRSPPSTNRRFRVSQLRYLFGNSTVVLLSRTLIELVNQGDYIVLGLIASKTTIGYYFFAFRFSAQPVRMLAGNVTNVIFPALTQFRGDPVRQREAVVRASRLLGYLVMPFCFLQAALAQPGLHFLFGERWMAAVPYVVILSLGLPFDAMSWITGAFLSARREFTRAFRYALVSTPVFYGMVLLGGWLDGPMGVALAVALYYFTYPPAFSYLVLIGAGVAWTTVFEFYAMPAVLSGIAAAAGLGCALLPGIRNSDLLQCLAIGIVMCSVYLMLLAGFRRDMLNQILDRFSGLTSRLRRR
ncbi:oligosaccharide flippase family protein [Acetobacter musti]|uniref:Oligosaccharide flippase family protein n=1 Tax=Acetobacter musti TaxID=864732 RepID=A0ABX0JNM3_9PROT|nr:lipopolysaccharide biosynthesis protein [Acetobacter musti]NHN84205.1 oligosaccharide flippase family protein [Acetobacter musti]